LSTITTQDGTEIHYNDWGKGQPVVFSHGWPLSADAFEDQMFFLASRGYRCIAHDRRGHGRSSQPWIGNDMDTYADDLAELVQKLDLEKAIHVGHSTGGGEVTRYIGRHGTKRVAKAVLISAVPPLMLKTPANPAGLPIDVFDGLRSGVQADRSQLWKDLSLPFYGYNRPGSKVSEGVRESFWLQGMMAGFPASYFCIKAFSEADQTKDLKQIDVPTLIIQGDDDQIVFRRFRPAPGQTDQGCGTEGLQGRAARPLHHAQGPGERRSARLHPAQGSAPGCLAHDPEPWRRRTVCMLEHLGNHRRRFVGGAALTGDANGAPHPDQAVYAEKFSGKYDRRLIRGGIGHNLTEVAPRAFAQAVVDAAPSP